MKTLTTEQIENLRILGWEKANEKEFTVNVGDILFNEYAGDLLETSLEQLRSVADIMGTVFNVSFCYRKPDIEENGQQVYFLGYLIDFGNNITKYGNIAQFTGVDEFRLFTPIEEEKSTKEKLIECINNYCNENTRSAFIDFLGDEIPGIWEDIFDIVRENLDTEETAKQWIDDNNGDAIDYVFSNCDTYDLKGYVIDFIRDNL